MDAIGWNFLKKIEHRLTQSWLTIRHKVQFIYGNGMGCINYFNGNYNFKKKKKKSKYDKDLNYRVSLDIHLCV